MSSKFSSRLLPRHQLSKLLRQLEGTRKPARVVTPGGVSPRGTPSSWKCEAPRFQSLVEEDSQRVLEVAGHVTAFQTHPMVLHLGSGAGKTRYTPDLIAWFGDYGAVFEVKPERKLSSLKTAIRLKEVISQLALHGIPLCLILDTDVRASGLQTTLKLLERERPVRGHFRHDIDPSLWDPLGRAEPTSHLAERWKSAQRICNELLERVMRRDPDDLIPTSFK